ncbi:MAG TPA: response regulator [Ktedonobacteraceae bacterium]|nr:response regulator [Ktedonobacteraceae bacterium]
MARILVVNDTQEILELFRILLEEEEGHEVILSGFPFQHIDEVKKIKPDLIILDFVFGDQKSGWQMLQMLKMQRSTAHIPVIVCTAALDEVREQEGYLVSQGIHVIYKPFDIEPLLQNVRELLEKHEHVSATADEEEEEDDENDDDEER